METYGKKIALNLWGMVRMLRFHFCDLCAFPLVLQKFVAGSFYITYNEKNDSLSYHLLFYWGPGMPVIKN